jgi:hypothetical protein
MATTAQYGSTPLNEISQVTAANTARDGTGTMGVGVAGTTAGKFIRRVVIQATGTVTNGVVRFFESVDSGTTRRLLHEVIVTATTPSVTQAAFRVEVPELVGKVLAGTTNLIYPSTNNAETFNVFFESGLL